MSKTCQTTTGNVKATRTIHQAQTTIFLLTTIKQLSFFPNLWAMCMRQENGVCKFDRNKVIDASSTLTWGKAISPPMYSIRCHWNRNFLHHLRLPNKSCTCTCCLWMKTGMSCSRNVRVSHLLDWIRSLRLPPHLLEPLFWWENAKSYKHQNHEQHSHHHLHHYHYMCSSSLDLWISGETTGGWIFQTCQDQTTQS